MCLFAQFYMTTNVFPRDNIVLFRLLSVPVGRDRFNRRLLFVRTPRDADTNSILSNSLNEIFPRDSPFRSDKVVESDFPNQTLRRW